MISRFEKEMRNLTYTIKDETLKKHILESFLKRMQLLTPNQQLKKKTIVLKKSENPTT